MTKVDLYESLTNKIIAELTQGVIPWEKPWFASKPINAITGKGYRGVNHLSLNLTLSELKLEKSDSRFLTFNQAKDKGYKVRKGEKAVAKVVYFSLLEKPKSEDKKIVVGDDETASKTVPLLKYSPVFHASQVEGIPDYVPEPHFDSNTLAEEILKNSKAKIIADPARAYYSPSQDLIGMPSVENFKTKAGYYGTLLHELGHWTGHSSRLGRNMDCSFGTELYAKEELVAELASIFLCAETGIEYQAGNHQAYINNWVKVLKDDPLEIKRASSQAMKVVSYLLNLTEGKTFEVNH